MSYHLSLQEEYMTDESTTNKSVWYCVNIIQARDTQRIIISMVILQATVHPVSATDKSELAMNTPANTSEIRLVRTP